MNGTDTPLDGMLRHLGAAYYDSLHGRTAPTEVVRHWTASPSGFTRRPPACWPRPGRPPESRTPPGHVITTCGTAGYATS